MWGFSSSPKGSGYVEPLTARPWTAETTLGRSEYCAEVRPPDTPNRDAAIITGQARDLQESCNCGSPLCNHRDLYSPCDNASAQPREDRLRSAQTSANSGFHARRERAHV
jgi:hypothetical protein